MGIAYTSVMSSDPVGNISGSNIDPLELNFSRRVSAFENRVIQAEVNPEVNVRHTIHAIIHPFQRNELQGRNMDFYRKIISEVAENQSSFLYYVATCPDIRDEEIDLQNVLYDQPDEVYQRLALLTDTEGYNSWSVPGYNPGGLIDIAKSVPTYSSLCWFAQNGVRTYYTPELAKAYTDISGLTKMQRSEIEERSDFGLFAEGNKEFLSVPLHPQVAKLIRFLGVRQERIEGRFLLTLDNKKRRNTKIVVYGESLESDGFGESMRLAILLGLPLENVSFNKEQPYLSEREKERAYFRRPPIEALYPPENYRESLNRGFLK